MDIREIPGNIPMKLIEMVEILIPNILRADNHSAGSDALMHWMVSRELVLICEQNCTDSVADMYGQVAFVDPSKTTSW